MSISDLLHYVAEHAIPPSYFGFSAYVFSPKDYSITSSFPFLSGSITFVPRSFENPYMKIV